MSSTIKAKRFKCTRCLTWADDRWHKCPHGQRCLASRWTKRPECRGCQLANPAVQR
jgi:hypothetical protein